MQSYGESPLVPTIVFHGSADRIVHPQTVQGSTTLIWAVERFTKERLPTGMVDRFSA